MSKSPVCKKCHVVKALSEIIEAYDEFVVLLGEKDLNNISDHARGYCHAQLRMGVDVISELESLIPHLRAEAALRAQSDKGL